MTDTNTAADTSKSNGADKSLNGAGLAAVAAAINPPSAPMPPAATLRTSTAPLPTTSRAAASERLLMAERDSATPTALEGFSRFGQTAVASLVDDHGATARLDATTRMVNAFMGYLMTACGRTPDQMTAHDVAAMGQLLGTVEKLEVSKTRQGH